MTKILQKLDEEKHLLVVKMYAECVTPTEISKWMKENWAIDYLPDSISRMVKREKYEPHLKRFREDYMKKVKDVPIANKRIRIDDLERVRVKIMKQIEDNSLGNASQREEFRYLVRSLNDIIVNAREEMEKKPFLMVGLGDFSDKTDEQLIEERNEILRQAQRSLVGGAIEASVTSAGTVEPDQSQSS